MRGVYDAPYKIASVAAAKTLLYITAPSNKVVQILDSEFTDLDSIVSQQLEIYWKKIGTLGTPTATTLTPSKTEDGDQAAGSTVKANVTASEPTYTANTEKAWKGANTLAGWDYKPIPERTFYIAGGDTYGIYLATTPGTAFGGLVYISFREIG